MEEKEHQFLIVGLPEAGKTSFIHAVDDLIHGPPSGDALRSCGLALDRSYLERDKGRFRAGKKLEHTERNLQGPMPELWFEHQATNRKGRLFLPDVSGEIFQDQWIDRKWGTAFRESLSNIGGMLVFVRADVPASTQELLGPLAALPASGDKGPPWNRKRASPQVQLVDVLQFIALKGKVTTPLKTAVMISAWDTVRKPHNLQPKTPGAFLAREWALLDQYLRANPETFETRIYGVSALGGSEQELAAELNKLAPQDRVELVEDAHNSRDLTRPLRWLLGLN